jgi:hypothetical protein
MVLCESVAGQVTGRVAGRVAPYVGPLNVRANRWKIHCWASYLVRESLGKSLGEMLEALLPMSVRPGVGRVAGRWQVGCSARESLEEFLIMSNHPVT